MQKKTNNTNLCTVGEVVYSDLDQVDITILAISPAPTMETHGFVGCSHAYEYIDHKGQYNLIYPWEITRYNEEGKLMFWGPGLDDYGNELPKEVKE